MDRKDKSKEKIELIYPIIKYMHKTRGDEEATKQFDKYYDMDIPQLRRLSNIFKHKLDRLNAN